MLPDFKILLWLLKLGAILNLFLFVQANTLWSQQPGEPHLLLAQIFFLVSAFRCVFPVRYKDQVVLHDTVFSSIFLTRALATFAELAFIYLLSEVLRRLNSMAVGWVTVLSWYMVFQVVLSQVFVWWAIASQRLVLYVYEEVGWAGMLLANTLASAFLYWTLDPEGGPQLLLLFNLLFGAIYLPWQAVHLYSLMRDAGGQGMSRSVAGGTPLGVGLWRALTLRRRTTESGAWGGLIGLTWMVAYWATLLPLWVDQIVWLLP